MWKLTCANTVAMLRSKRLWTGAGLLLAYDLASYALSGLLRAGDRGLDSRIFEFMGIAALLVPVVTALFVNTDYHDGTIRSKLSVGHSRPAVYLANLTVCTFTGLFYFVLHLLAALPLGCIGGGALRMGAGELAIRLATSAGVLLSLTAVTVAVSMLMAHRAVTVVVIFMMALLLDGAALLENQLAQPPEVRDVVGTVEVVDEKGELDLRYVDREGRELKVSETAMAPNPLYISEPLRTGLCVFNDLLPGGQIFHLMGLTEREVPMWTVGLSALVTAMLSTALGLMLFRRKDLR